mgnify:CR=1 FL=1
MSTRTPSWCPFLCLAAALLLWAAPANAILYEVGGVPEDVARQVLNRMAHKMPIKCRLAKRITTV